MTKHWTDGIDGCCDGRECPCGSGEESEMVSDAWGINVVVVCDDCRRDRLGGYRRGTFEDAAYGADEEIEEIA
mgnify:CR=1 FL=1